MFPDTRFLCLHCCKAFFFFLHGQDFLLRWRLSIHSFCCEWHVYLIPALLGEMSRRHHLEWSSILKRSFVYCRWDYKTSDTMLAWMDGQLSNILEISTFSGRDLIGISRFSGTRLSGSRTFVSQKHGRSFHVADGLCVLCPWGFTSIEMGPKERNIDWTFHGRCRFTHVRGGLSSATTDHVR